MYHILWEYDVRADRLPDFETLYGSTGAWALLFNSADGYRGTELYRDAARPTHFLTLDRWSSRAAFEACIQAMGDAYRRLDEQAAALTVSERRLGDFEA